MKPFRLSIWGLVVLVAVVGLDLAVMNRAFQHGRWAESVTGYLVGFGLVLMMFNLGLIQLGLTISRHKGRSTGALLSIWVSPMLSSRSTWRSRLSRFWPAFSFAQGLLDGTGSF